MSFSREADFEQALVNLLFTKGWEKEVLKNYDEEMLIKNWSNILFENNREVDKLNGIPLTRSEMQQILDQITNLKTPLNLNGFINGKSVMITRDNEEDKLHFGKQVSLKIYDRKEIAAGQSRYQIVEQPLFKTKAIMPGARGDLMLLINGMPLFHIELKKSGVPVSQACRQIEKYAHYGVYTGIFSLVQIFVAMNPEETLYFANPGPDGMFNSDYYFHWADFNNEPVNDWKDIGSSFLSIPMAHQLIGFYTVADNTDGILKVMRSYQYYAANAISDKVSKNQWDSKKSFGGYIWHTTGSGKTMTSFKSAQLIANSKDADKVIFLMDRIELGTQSLLQYRGFADETDDVQSTEDTYALLSKLKSDDPSNTLIVTSIQKMSNINVDSHGNDVDIDIISRKRLVFVVDECHRSTFGDMLATIKKTFPKAIFFGFTGTPIHDENKKHMLTTRNIFGNELHRYSIADGIRDKNVLGFDPYMVQTFREKDLRQAVALDMAKASTVAEIFNDKKKEEIFFKYMNEVGMTDKIQDGKCIPGIEPLLPKGQYYMNDKHFNAVVDNILENWDVISRGGKFHAILATNSIKEAMEYYKIFKSRNTNLKVTALFDPSIDNNEGNIEKANALAEIVDDYNRLYSQEYTISTFYKMKKDISLRLSHKKQYSLIDRDRSKVIDLLIVVDQMLTGFDSKWINALYLDKVLRYENIIQAFSRTNRLFGQEKPFGIIKYYRYPFTMAQNIDNAIKLYSGDKELGLFASKLNVNLREMNSLFEQIKFVFESVSIVDFKNLPKDKEDKQKFSILFRQFNKHLRAAEIQGYDWNKTHYDIYNDKGELLESVDVGITKHIYYTLVQRYKELMNTSVTVGGGDDIPYDIDANIAEIDTSKIDYDYMNKKFAKYIKTILLSGASKEAIDKALNDLHSSFASLSQEEQKYANIFLHDVQTGDVKVDINKTLTDYISEYIYNAKNDQVHRLSVNLGLDENKLRKLMNIKITESNINEYGRFDDLKNSIDKQLAKKYIEKKIGRTLPLFKVNIEIDNLLRKFLINGEIE